MSGYPRALNLPLPGYTRCENYFRFQYYVSIPRCCQWIACARLQCEGQQSLQVQAERSNPQLPLCRGKWVRTSLLVNMKRWLMLSSET
jgi:hypothetical protein